MADSLLATTFRFRVLLHGSAGSGASGALGSGGFQECTGLEVEMDVSEFPEGGSNDAVVQRAGRAKYTKLVLKRGMFVPARGHVDSRCGSGSRTWSTASGPSAATTAPSRCSATTQAVVGHLDLHPGPARQAGRAGPQRQDGRRGDRGAPHRPRGTPAWWVMTLHKATLQEIDPKASRPAQLIGSPITVQVNPTSLRLALTNNTDVGKSVGRPNTPFQGLSSSTLSFDLMMDTADQGSTANPTDVHTLTAQLEYFLLPKTGDAKAVPPRLLFIYGSLKVAGVMSALNLEYDLFADTGMPLRAKASVTIKEQKPQFDADLLGAGANTGAATANPLPGPGGSGAPASPDRTGTALGGE